MMRTTSVCLALAGTIAATSIAQAQNPASTRIAAGFSRPVFVTAPPGNTSRLFVVEQRNSGAVSTRADIRIIDLTTNPHTVLGTPFLSINPVATGSEQGLLGMAFHPNYANNGYFFVHYNMTGGATVIARYRVNSLNPNVADPASATTLLTQSQPFSNHNGGWIAFAPGDTQGYLHINLGDGGSANDPNGAGQNINTLLGKTLRIDIDGADNIPGNDDDDGIIGNGSTNGYTSPPSNPFYGPTAGLDEILHYGLRNPWRASFDRANGDLFIGDVGQNAREEVNWAPAGATGRNFGWRCMEGLNCTGLSGCTCNSASLTNPFYNYVNPSSGCTVVGGYVYRGSAIPSIQGHYFFADYCSNQIWSCRYDGVQMTDFVTRTTQLAPGGGLSIASISSFGEDAAGEMYICDLSGGEVFKIIPGPPLNDVCINATLVGGSSSTNFSTAGATTDGPDETTCGFTGNTQIGADVWYRFVAGCTGTATVGVCGSTFDTRLAAYVGCPTGPGAALACNDDHCGTSSQISFSVTSGTVYRVRLGGVNSATGTGTLVINCAIPCPADVNGDGNVNVTDLLAVINNWGPCPGCAADINGDGTVNVTDLLAVINNWGQCGGGFTDGGAGDGTGAETGSTSPERK